MYNKQQRSINVKERIFIYLKSKYCKLLAQICTHGSEGGGEEGGGVKGGGSHIGTQMLIDLLFIY